METNMLFVSIAELASCSVLHGLRAIHGPTGLTAMETNMLFVSIAELASCSVLPGPRANLARRPESKSSRFNGSAGAAR